MTCAVIQIKIDSVNKFAINNTAIITERDFKSEFLFRMWSVTTDLATSLKFRPIRCASTLCHFGGTRKGYVATHFILLSSTAETSATSGNMVVRERFSQNEEPANTKEERAKKQPSFVPCS